MVKGLRDSVQQGSIMTWQSVIWCRLRSILRFQRLDKCIQVCNNFSAKRHQGLISIIDLSLFLDLNLTQSDCLLSLSLLAPVRCTLSHKAVERLISKLLLPFSLPYLHWHFVATNHILFLVLRFALTISDPGDSCLGDHHLGCAAPSQFR